MEVWGAQRLSDGFNPVSSSGNLSFQLDPMPVNSNTTPAQ